jgi:hypothetical protein
MNGERGAARLFKCRGQCGGILLGRTRGEGGGWEKVLLIFSYKIRRW